MTTDKNDDVIARMRATANRAVGAHKAPEEAVAYATAKKVVEKAAVKTETAVETHHEEEIQIADRTATELHIKENYFYQALTETATTQEEKILAIADALNPKKQPLEKLLQNYKAFQEYYTYLQSEDLDQVLENVDRMIKDLQSNTKIEIKRILSDLQGMLDDVNSSRELVELLRQARLSNKTIEQLQEAFKRNESIVKELGELEAKKATAKLAVDAADGIVTAKTKERDIEEGKNLHKILNVFRKDTTYSDRVTDAQAIKTNKEAALKAVEDRITALTAERNKDLEEGPIKILRSIDEVDDNLTDRLVSSAQKGKLTITGAQKSALQLQQRTLNSEVQVDQASRRVADKQITLTVLKSGLAEASKNTNDFKEGLETASAETEVALATAKGAETPSVLEVAKYETEAINKKTEAAEIISYQSKLNDTITEMNDTVAKNILRQGEVDGAKGIVRGTKKSITVLARNSLNTVAGNLEGALTSLVADQTDETERVIATFARAAENVNKGTMESMMTRQQEMHDKDMSFLDDTITRLNESRDLIAKTLEMSVDEGISRADKQRELKSATEQLEQATTIMRTTVGKMSNDSVQDGPARPTAEPEVKAGPANTL